jgi:SAM-dependent methyltransferase
MSSIDLAYVAKNLRAGHVRSPCLEVGVGWEMTDGYRTSRPLVQSEGIEYFGADMKPGPLVDIVVDCSADGSVFAEAMNGRTFGTVICLNVLEHVFDPVQTLRNLVSTLRPGGTCVIVTPTIWPLHECPLDCWRINPNFYEEFARRNDLEVLSLEYVTHKIDVASVKYWDEGVNRSTYRLPPRERSVLDGYYSRLVHGVFATHGRGASIPDLVSTGTVLQKRH